jgi:TolB-like protein/class 3 adenylate cyclase
MTYPSNEGPAHRPGANRSAAPEQHVERKLTAILVADVVGYSRLMGADEEGTLTRLKALRRDLIDPKIAEHGGRIIKLMGDGALVEFPSVVDAVRCAVEIQAAMPERNAEVPPEKQIAFRIGINVGDVIIDGQDIYGDGVNIGARLQASASPGTVLVSGTAHDHVHNKLPYAFDYLGEQHVKNIARPVRVYRVRPEPAAVRWRATFSRRLARPRLVISVVLLAVIGTAGGLYFNERGTPIKSLITSALPGSTANRTATLPDQPIIAVLPFNNMSGDANLDYFSDGITEDLTTWLSQNPELVVISRTSAFAYKGKSPDIREVGRTLGARYVLEGSVRKDNDRVRITAQLIDAASGHHVWAERYAEEGNDVAALQDAVTHKIVSSIGSMHGQIRATVYRNAWSKDPGKLLEYDYFLRIHGLIMRGPKEDLEQARQVAFEGLQHFPNSAIIKIKLAWTYLNDVRRGYSDDPARDLERAFSLGSEGMAGHDIPRLGQMHGHWLMALAYFYCKQDYPRALEERDTTLAMAPIDAIVLVDLSQTLTFSGRPAEAIASIRKAIELDPGFPAWFHTYKAEAHYAAGDNRDTIAELGQAGQSQFRTLIYRAASYAALGQLDEARTASAELQKWSSGTNLAKLRYEFPFQTDSDRERMIADLRKAGLPDG